MNHRVRLMLLAGTISAACSDETLTSDRTATLIGELDAFKREAFSRSAQVSHFSQRARARAKRMQGWRSHHDCP